MVRIFDSNLKSKLRECSSCCLSRQTIAICNFLLGNSFPAQVLSREKIDLTIRTNLLPNNPQSDALMVEIVFTNQLPCSISCAKLGNADAACKFWRELHVFCCDLYFVRVLLKTSENNFGTISICTSYHLLFILLLHTYYELPHSPFSDYNVFANKKAPLNYSELEPGWEENSDSHHCVKSMI